MSRVQQAKQSVDPSSSFVPMAMESLSTQSAALANLADRVGQEFDDVVRLILACKGRVIVSGMGKSGIVGKKIAATLASTGTPSFYIHPGEAIHGDLGMVTNEDLVILISHSGETEEILRLLPSFEYFGNRIVSIVGAPNTPLEARSHVSLRADIEREVCPNNLAPTTSALAIMALGDALAVCLIHARDFKPQDFAQFHPGGILGRRLLAKVQDCMVSEDLPLISPNETVRESIFCMTAGRLGLAIIVEGRQLLGILTDGDLRRALIMDPSMQEKPVREFMTPVPVTIRDDAMVSDAEMLMRRYKIRALIVTGSKPGEENTVKGLVEIFADTCS